MPLAAWNRDPEDLATADWLLASAEPGIRVQVRRDLLGEAVSAADLRAISSGPIVEALLSGQRPDGSFGSHPYQKWSGAHWRLVSLIELGLPAGETRALAATDGVLNWLASESHHASIRTIDGRVRRCASQEGNALAVCVRLGLAGEPRVAQLADALVEWQWPDGGWNCDKTPAASHSSFHESLPPVWGLAEYARATGSTDAAAASRRGADLFLEHHLYRSHTTGDVINAKWLRAHYPPYWHYNFVYGLDRLARAGALPDERAAEAIELLRSQRRSDGLWHVAGSPYWRRSGDTYSDPAPWVRSGPSEMLTLSALRIIKAASQEV